MYLGDFGAGWSRCFCGVLMGGKEGVTCGGKSTLKLCTPRQPYDHLHQQKQYSTINLRQNTRVLTCATLISSMPSAGLVVDRHVVAISYKGKSLPFIVTSEVSTLAAVAREEQMVVLLIYITGEKQLQAISGTDLRLIGRPPV